MIKAEPVDIEELTKVDGKFMRNTYLKKLIRNGQNEDENESLPSPKTSWLVLTIAKTMNTRRSACETISLFANHGIKVRCLTIVGNVTN